MRVALASIFQDSTSYLERYFNQVSGLADVLYERGDALYAYWAEGDSSDGTADALAKGGHAILDHWCYEVKPPVGVGFTGFSLLERSHGGPKYGSVDDIRRWRQLAPVLNATLEAVTPYFDAVIYVESDLIWEPSTMLRLLSHLADYPAVGGLIYHSAGFFYDTYAYRKSGQRFGSDYQPVDDSPFRLDSIGSCIVMRGEVARVCRFGADTCLIGESLKDHGYELWVDPTCRIMHP